MKNVQKIFVSMLVICVIAGSLFTGCGKKEVAADFTTNIVWADMFGDQEGAMTVMPSTSKWSIEFENLYGVYTIAGTYSEDGTMTITEDAGMKDFLPLEEIYKAGEKVVKSFLDGTVDYSESEK